MVGTGRFELPTPRTPSECSTRLSHVPTDERAACGSSRNCCSAGVIRILHHGRVSQPDTVHVWRRLDPAAVFHRPCSDKNAPATRECPSHTDLDCVILPVRVDIDQREIRPFALWLDGDDVLIAFSAGFEFDDVAAVVARTL